MRVLVHVDKDVTCINVIILLQVQTNYKKILNTKKGNFGLIAGYANKDV